MAEGLGPVIANSVVIFITISLSVFFMMLREWEILTHYEKGDELLQSISKRRMYNKRNA